MNGKAIFTAAGALAIATATCIDVRRAAPAAPVAPVAAATSRHGSYVRREDPEIAHPAAHHVRAPMADEAIRCDGADILELHGSSCHFTSDNALVAPGEYPYSYDSDAGSILDTEDGGGWSRWPMHWAAPGVRCGSMATCFIDRTVYPAAGVYDLEGRDLFVPPAEGRWTRGDLFESGLGHGGAYVCQGKQRSDEVVMGTIEWCPGPITRPGTERRSWGPRSHPISRHGPLTRSASSQSTPYESFW